MQMAIVTVFETGPDGKPCVRANCSGKTTTLPYESLLSLDDNHAAAAQKLAGALHWRHEWVFARLPSGDYCHVALAPVRRFSTEPANTTRSPEEVWRGR